MKEINLQREEVVGEFARVFEDHGWDSRAFKKLIYPKEREGLAGRVVDKRTEGRKEVFIIDLQANTAENEEAQEWRLKIYPAGAWWRDQVSKSFIAVFDKRRFEGERGPELALTQVYEADFNKVILDGTGILFFVGKGEDKKEQLAFWIDNEGRLFKGKDQPINIFYRPPNRKNG